MRNTVDALDEAAEAYPRRTSIVAGKNIRSYIARILQLLLTVRVRVMLYNSRRHHSKHENRVSIAAYHRYFHYLFADYPRDEEDRMTVHTEPKLSTSEGHVMISYHRASSLRICEKICSRLKVNE